jgi:hypothetical protein
VWREQHVVRVGRNSVERWVRAGRGLTQQASTPVDGATGLGAAVSAVLAGVRGNVVAVLESTWLPVMLVPTGGTMWRRQALDGLLRHRFALLHDSKDDPVSAWQLLSDHRPGAPSLLGFGLSPAVRQAVLGGVQAAGLRITSLQPALAWAWLRLKGASTLRGSGWWVWLEQDRALIVRVESGVVTALNAGAALPDDLAGWRRLVDVEASRCGLVQPDGTGIAAGWIRPAWLGAARSDVPAWFGAAVDELPVGGRPAPIERAA